MSFVTLICALITLVSQSAAQSVCKVCQSNTAVEGDSDKIISSLDSMYPILDACSGAEAVPCPTEGDVCHYTDRKISLYFTETDETLYGRHSTFECLPVDLSVVMTCEMWSTNYPDTTSGIMVADLAKCEVLTDDGIPRTLLGLPEPTEPAPELPEDTEVPEVPQEASRCMQCHDLVKIAADGSEEAQTTDDDLGACSDNVFVDCDAGEVCKTTTLATQSEELNFRSIIKGCYSPETSCTDVRVEAESRGATVTDCDVAESRDIETEENDTDEGNDPEDPETNDPNYNVVDPIESEVRTDNNSASSAFPCLVSVLLLVWSL